MKTGIRFLVTTMWLAAATLYLILRIIYGFRANGATPLIVCLLAGLVILTVWDYLGHRRAKTPKT